MAPPTNSLQLSKHETLHGDGVCYIMFSRENEKDPTKRYEQMDVMPWASSDSDHTFIRPLAKPIPTVMDDTDIDEPWVLNKATGMWERGYTTWGPPSFILRVFTYRGEYKQQLHFGKTWKKFDRAALKFDPNDTEIVRKYNAWLKFIMETFQTGPGISEVGDVPWTKKERFCLRMWLDVYIEEEGLVAWARRFDWSDEVLKFNIFLIRAGCHAQGRMEADILKEFGQDEVIYKCFVAAQAMERRWAAGERLGRQELYPKNFIPLREGLDEIRVQAAVEDSVHVEETEDAEVEEDVVMGDSDMA